MNALVAQVGIPHFVRIKPGTLDRLGIYAARHGHEHVVIIASAGLVPDFIERAQQSLIEHRAKGVAVVEAESASFKAATELLKTLPSTCQAIFGLGGGKALDVAKYVAFLAGRPFYAVPTSL